MSLDWLSSALAADVRNAAPRISAPRVSRADERGRPPRLLCRLSIRDGRTLLIPMDTAAAGIGALRLYRPQRLGARISRTMLTAALRAGIARYLLPAAGALVQIQAEKHGGGAPFLLDYLEEVFARDDPVFGIHFGASGPVRKPVVAVVSRHGRTLGFAKTGWNEHTVSLVENERRTLEALSAAPLAHGRFPAVRHFARWNGRCVLVTEPLSLRGGGMSGRRLTPLHLQFLIEVAGISEHRRSFEESGLFARLRGRLSSMRSAIPAAHARALDEAVDFLASSLGSIEIPWVWRLGDFTPGNTGIEPAAGRITCIDVEYAESDGVPGWDLFHFLGQDAGRSTRSRDIISAVRRDCHSYFDALRISPRLIPVLYAAYLADHYSLWAQLWARCDGPLTAPAAEALARLVGLLDESVREQKAERGFRAAAP
jgi:hypothetical protein